MVIEVLVRGEVLLAARIPEELLQRDRKIPFKEDLSYREELIQKAILILENEMERLLIPGDQVSYRLTVGSKMEDPDAPFY